MIGDAVERSLGSPKVLISVGELFLNAAGSRMPDVNRTCLPMRLRVAQWQPVRRWLYKLTRQPGGLT